MQPLYRRGPAFHASAEPPPWQSLFASYGPPAEHAPAFAVDLELFSVYFLVAETLSTFVGYRITQHCLRGCRVSFLSPAARLLIGMLYCSMKIKLIDYAFHGSAYYTFSLLLMIWYFANAALALGFHFGPLLFLFYDYIPRSKMTQSLFQKLAAVCATFSTRAELYVLQHLACMPPPGSALGRADVDTTGLQLMAGKSESAASFCDAQHPAPAPGVSRMTLAFGRVVDVQIDLWNRSLFLQWLPTLRACGRSSALRVRDLLDVFECRYMFVMQRDGLLLGFFMATPTATTMTKLRTVFATPFELVLRFHTRSESGLALDAAVVPVFLYAQSPRLVGRASPPQERFVFQMLRELNGAQGCRIDVPLRALRCKNFVDAGTGQIVKKKQRSRSLLNAFENSFG
ncbi:hypothetical protein PybrP1_008429 [[Pythium] brassicae (nom. inval.)]|nr:hypothetical protein PybrP1_008429 [[Pythium] brassicae (nom. inval.)]